jgi:hypothetical protein
VGGYVQYLLWEKYTEGTERKDRKWRSFIIAFFATVQLAGFDVHFVPMKPNPVHSMSTKQAYINQALRANNAICDQLSPYSMQKLHKCSLIKNLSGLRLRKFIFHTSGLHRRPFHFVTRSWAVQYHLSMDYLTKFRILNVQ